MNNAHLPEVRKKAGETQRKNNQKRKEDQDNEGVKTCLKCKETLALNLFRYHKTNFDHLCSSCRKCEALQRKERDAKRVYIKRDHKTCARCKEEKSVDCFRKNKGVKDGLDGWCKSCTKDRSLERRYNSSLEEYQNLLNLQNYKCAICDTDKPGGPTNMFVVDHCHKTGKIRGLLCNHCNTGIGKLHDSPVLLRKAAEYIENSEEN
jgi:hypothetical protein